MKIKYFVLLPLLIGVSFVSSVLAQEDSLDVYVDSTYYEDDYYNEYDDEYSEDIDGADVERTFMVELGLSVKKPLPQMRPFRTYPLGFELGIYKQLFSSKPIYLGGSFFIDFYDKAKVFYYDYSSVDGVEYQYSESLRADMLGLRLGIKVFSPRSFWVLNPYFDLNVEWRRGFSIVKIDNLDLDETEDSDFEGGNSSLGYEVGIGSIIDINSDNIYMNFELSIDSGSGLYLYVRSEKSSELKVRDNFDYKYFPISFLTFKLGFVFY